MSKDQHLVLHYNSHYLSPILIYIELCDKLVEYNLEILIEIRII